MANCLLEAMIKQSNGEFKKALRTKLSLFAFGIQDKRTHNYITHYLSRFFDEPKLLIWRTVKAFSKLTELIREDRNWNMQFSTLLFQLSHQDLKRRIEIYQLTIATSKFSTQQSRAPVTRVVNKRTVSTRSTPRHNTPIQTQRSLLEHNTGITRKSVHCMGQCRLSGVFTFVTSKKIVKQQNKTKTKQSKIVFTPIQTLKHQID